ncbi:olfactory receptor 52R1-like [Rhinatrema bivittatum]|uniref:olfactory receptor 52R1-like n=1 Tax=Rhinatrema bivittatum TaxID=194408 RepID=UPI00112B1349|nr:olfactory receptor 52R1-like [Rhinatrema bivittatum]
MTRSIRDITLVMPVLNNTNVNPVAFILIGIPGLESVQCWISIPFSVMYLMALLGNCTILFIIRTEPSLHEPMYLFLSMLAATDLILSTSTLPKMLAIFWFNAGDIAFDACLIQMFFIHSFTAMESGFFLAMAFDRYIAICNPLRHSLILTNPVISKIGFLVVLRAVIFFSPHPFLVKKLSYCQTNVIHHTYCEFMAVMKLACEDTFSSKAYSLTVASLIGSFDLLSTAVSYVFILRTVLSLPSKEASLKAFSTCSSHICVILVFYTTAVFTFLTHRFGHNVAPQIHITVANIYLLVPPMLNPIIYGVRTKKIRQRVFKMFYYKTI